MAELNKPLYALDFEMYYDKDYNIDRYGYVALTRHEKFDPFLVSIYGDNVEYVGHPKDAPWSDIDGGIWVAHNAIFDRCVYNALSLPWKPSRWLDSAAMVVYCGYPRGLAKASQFILGIEVSKEVRSNAKGKTPQDLKDAGEWDDMLEYCLNDSKHTYNITKKVIADFPQHEWDLSELTMKQTIRGYRADPDMVREAMNKLKAAKDHQKKFVPWMHPAYTQRLIKQRGGKPLPKYMIPTVQSKKHLTEYCEANGIPEPSSMAVDSPDYKAWTYTYGKDHPVVTALSEFKSINTFEKKVRKIKDRMINVDGQTMFHAGLKYFGAHTGRWSGSTKYNEQNLPRGAKYGVDLRSLHLPRLGHKYVIVDLSQIEPRCMAYITKDQAFMDLVRTGISPYEAHARLTMGWDGGKLKDENKQLYSLAKARVLALGYGCGSGKFSAMAEILAGLTLTDEESAQIVKEFRETNTPITDLWAKLQALLSRSVGNNFHLKLPSGRLMTYYNVTSTRTTRFGRAHTEYKAQLERGGFHNRLYGGLLAENLIQAFARDVFAHNLLILDKEGYRVVLTVHDEVIVEVPEAKADEELNNVIDIMSTTPDWAPGLPVAAEGEVAESYIK